MTVGDWAKYTSEGGRSTTWSGQPGEGGGVSGEGVRRSPLSLTARESVSYG